MKNLISIHFIIYIFLRIFNVSTICQHGYHVSLSGCSKCSDECDDCSLDDLIKNEHKNKTYKAYTCRANWSNLYNINICHHNRNLFEEKNIDVKETGVVFDFKKE